jgi:hypothetical protein
VGYKTTTCKLKCILAEGILSIYTTQILKLVPIIMLKSSEDVMACDVIELDFYLDANT